MAKKTTPKKSATRSKKSGGKAPTTQAGEFVAEEMEALHEGDPGVRSPKQAIAIGLSRARRAGVKVPAPKSGNASAATRKKAQTDLKRGQGKAKSKARRSAGAKKRRDHT